MVSYSLRFALSDFTTDSGILIPAESFYLSKIINFSGGDIFVGLCSPIDGYFLKYESDDEFLSIALNPKDIAEKGLSLCAFSSNSAEWEFSISHEASIALIDNIFNIVNSSSSTASLNGKYGSIVDGSLVTVQGKEGQFTVKSSELFWNDKDTNSYMLVYQLADSSGNFLMAPDIYVKKVV